MQTYDVIVVGKGNAALCAALAARDQGASVVVLEAANEDESGGNTRFAGGVMRFAYETVDDLKRVTDITDEEIATSDFGTNKTDEYFDDLFRLTSYRTDPDLSETLVTQSLDVMAWLRSKGARFLLNFGRQSGLVDGKRKFFGRMPIEVNGGGAGLVQYLDAAAKKAGIEILYDTRVISLIYDGVNVEGVRAQHKGALAEFRMSVQHAPAYVPARVALGTALYAGGKLDEAIQQWEEVLRMEPAHRTAGMYLKLARSQARPGVGAEGRKAR